MGVRLAREKGEPIRNTRRPSPALVISLVALFCSLTGTALALQANTVTSRHIVDGAVRDQDVRNGGLTGVKVEDDSLTGADITGLTGADVSSNSLTGSDVDEGSLTIDTAELGCQPGLVLGMVQIRGSLSLPSTYTTAINWISRSHSCVPADVDVRRLGTGVYDVRFNEGVYYFPGSTAVAAADEGGGSACTDNFVSVETDALAGVGRLTVRSFDNDGDAQDCWVNVAVF